MTIFFSFNLPLKKKSVFFPYFLNSHIPVLVQAFCIVSLTSGFSFFKYDLLSVISSWYMCML